MQYRKGSSGEDLSVLGYGCLRFTRNGNRIDLEKAEREIMEAIRSGVNYLDTAYVYGGSEAALGEILERNHCRDQIYLATKLPVYLIRTEAMIEKIFQEELQRLRTDHIDYYLMHMLNDVGTWERLRGWYIEDWIRRKKESGEIRHVGFSYHGSSQEFRKVVDIYPWDFCQIQYNYMDEHSQAGREGLHYAVQKGLHVVIMEPLRGGRLVNLLPKQAKEMIAAEAHGRSAADWGLRWLYDQPEVTTVLSGMNSLEMVRENLRIAEECTVGCMSEEEHTFIRKLRNEINAQVVAPCTGCAYCMPCPKHVDIPGSLRCLNLAASEGRKSARRDYQQTTIMRKVSSSASQCVQCGACERKCPQKLEIRRYLKDAARELEGPKYKIMKVAVHLGRFY